MIEEWEPWAVVCVAILITGILILILVMVTDNDDRPCAHWEVMTQIIPIYIGNSVMMVPQTIPVCTRRGEAIQ